MDLTMLERVRLLLMSFLIVVEGRNVEQQRYDTVYACEGKVLHLRCKENEVIHLIRANYGRFSVTVCNDQGNTEWRVNCMSSKSLRVLYGRCSHQQSCSVLASTSIFGDPCPGTFKYLEAHFKCIPAALSTTTVRPSPPWLLTSQPNVWSTAKVSTVRPPVPTALPPRTQSTKIPSLKIHSTTTPLTTSERSFEFTTDFDFDYDGSDVKNEVTTQVIVVSIPNDVESDNVWNDNEMCSPETARGLKWNWTKSGEFAVQPCPGGAAGVARWRCLEGTPPSRPQSPDLSECRSLWLAGLDLRIAEGDAVTSIADDLSQVTDSKHLFGGDLMTTAQIIKKLARKMSQNIQTYPDQRQREAIVTELLQGVVKTCSNLLDVSQLEAWKDLSHTEQMRVATSLLVGIEENSFLLADTVVREKIVLQSERNILLEVRVLESENILSEEFRFSGDHNSITDINTNDYWKGNDNWLRLEKKSLLENRSEGNLLRIVLVAYDHLENILVPDSKSNVTRVINSKVISASLGKGRHIQLSEPVTLCLKHLRTENVSDPLCVFWDYTTSNWSVEGCRVDSTNATHTICLCDHLTNFALLVELQDSSSRNDLGLLLVKIIIYFGCIISIICLCISVLTFTLLHSLKSDRTTVLQNLCICLLIAELLFVFGINRTDFPLICGLVAGFLHYFFLCAFAWMFLEGFQLYITFLEVFNLEKSRIVYYYLFGYGAPLVVVVISCVVDPTSYGTRRYCWLNADNFFILSFLAPVLAVIIANIVFLSLAVYMMCKQNSVKTNKDENRLGSSMIRLRGAIVFVFLLGLTWSFGLLYLSQESPGIAYVFSVLNASQGLFIVTFHCFRNDKARGEYVRILGRYFSCVEAKIESETVADLNNKERRPSLYGMHQQSESAQSSSGTVVAAVQPGWTVDDDSRSLPKSAANTWATLNARPVWKSSNFDVGSNVMTEEAVKTAAVLSDTLRNRSNYGTYSPAQYPHQLTTTGGRQRKRSRSGASQWNHHTYTEVTPGSTAGRGGEDPVYEEIERRERAPATDVRNADISDDELRRPSSDMSRQSSRSYGDHRPLIPYSPGTDRNFHSALDAAFRQRLKEQHQLLQQSTIAVLDGQTVVCHLQPDEHKERRLPPSHC